MNYNVIYDGNCNLCVTLVQLLENLDQGKNFEYTSMQDLEGLKRFGITASDCEMGMILIDKNYPEKRWQGSDAAEEIGRILPIGISIANSVPWPGAEMQCNCPPCLSTTI